MGANCFLGKWHPERRGDFSSPSFPLLSLLFSLSISLLHSFSSYPLILSFRFPAKTQAEKEREEEREREQHLKWIKLEWMRGSFIGPLTLDTWSSERRWKQFGSITYRPFFLPFLFTNRTQWVNEWRLDLFYRERTSFKGVALQTYLFTRIHFVKKSFRIIHDWENKRGERIKSTISSKWITTHTRNPCLLFFPSLKWNPIRSSSHHSILLSTILSPWQSGEWQEERGRGRERMAKGWEIRWIVDKGSSALR